MGDERAAQAASFGAAAAVYERGRPPYPPEAVDWLLAGAGPRVLDLGAGTGKLTRQLLARGLEVTAVEPSDGMREQLTAVVPRVRALAGTAESIPLPDGSVDAVVVAQAWHWVDTRRAVPEVARVLVPGGTLGLVWNLRDEREDWTAQLGRILRTGDVPPTGGVGVDALAEHPDLFERIEAFRVEWHYDLGHEDLMDLVASRSYVITMPSTERAALLSRVRDLTMSHPALAGRDRIKMPYVTHCYRARSRTPR